MSREQKTLVQIFSRLGEAERGMLLAFAEFLAARAATEAPAPVEPPREIPRPEEETVVGALKRLSATYHMLDKAKVLHETSALMSQHLLQGRASAEVIDELEIVFRRHYEVLIKTNGGDRP